MEFKQLATDEPCDVEATMTRSRAMSLQSEIAEEWDNGEDCDVFANLDVITNGDSAAVTFVIPGREAGEIGESFLPELEEQLDQWNNETIERLESED
jgi:hypothetical protein